MDNEPNACQNQKTGHACCPVLETTARLGNLSQDMVRTLNKLKRDLKSCDKCIENENCPILANFRSLVNIAIQEVTDEWNLNSSNLPIA